MKSPAEGRLEQIADAALAAALFTALDFQKLRYEGYETEKAAFLLLFASIIAAAHLSRIVTSPPRFSLRLLSQPVIVGALGLALVGGAATGFALSPAISWWGADHRAHGLLTLVAYLTLFAQAIYSFRRVQRFLPSILVVIAVTVSLYSLLMYAQGINRPGATMGHANFLASWLILALIILLHHATARRTIVGLAALASLIGVVLLIGASRGAITGLIMGLITSLLIVAALRHSRKLMVGLLVIAGGLIAVYALAAVVICSPAATSTEVTRIFDPTDHFRLVAWSSAVRALDPPVAPLLDVSGQPDRWAAIRPLIGYGLDTIPQVQSRFGKAFGEGIFLDSFHNAIWDDFATTGGLGLAASMLVYWGAIYGGLAGLQIVRRRDLAGWIGAQVLSSGGLLAIFSRLFPAEPLMALLPLAVGIGGVIGLWIGLMVLTLRGNRPRIALDSDHRWLIGLVAAAVAHWIDNQFGFATISGEILWWILLGLLVGLLLRTRPAEALESGKFWRRSVVSAGVVFLFSLSSLAAARIELSALLPILLALGGIAAAGVVFIVWAWGKDKLRRIETALLVIAVLSSTGYYAVNSVSATLHGLGNQLAAQTDENSVSAALADYDAALRLAPTSAQIRIDQSRALLTQWLLDTGDQLDAIQAGLRDLARYHPFFNNTLWWSDFLDQFHRLTGCSLDVSAAQMEPMTDCSGSSGRLG